MNSWRTLGVVCGLLAMGRSALAADTTATVVDRVPGQARTPLYPANREPLLASPLAKLPPGAVQPQGWLLKQLQLSADGMTGHLPEVSPWCKFEGNAWTNKDRSGRNGWEEVPYWLKGFGDLGYVLNDPRIIAENQRWLDAIIAAQADDGWFGPDGLRTNAEGHKGLPDLWPHMPVLNALQSNYEWTAAHGRPDERIIKLMQRYFRWELNQPEEGFLIGYWAQTRTGDNLESVYWLYNRTGEPWLLDLAKKIIRHTPAWKTKIPMWHNVNLAEGFRYPTEAGLLTADPSDLTGAQKVYAEIMSAYGQVPGGGFCADENARPGYVDPRQGFETCGMVEYMHSFEMLTAMTGDPAWADRCEDVALNDFPASMTADLRALHYLTSPNSIQLDPRSKRPDLANGGEMISYSPGGAYRCCQHNHGMGWPYYAENLWSATSDDGLCASMYAPSTVTANVGLGVGVVVRETTDYPFDGTVTLHVDLPAKSAVFSVPFPLYLRVPHWADDASVKVNGQSVRVESRPGAYLVVNNTWKRGDTVELTLPMHVSVRKWTKNKDSASVDYGPLTYALPIGERWQQYATVAPNWPAYSVYPTTDWNYGLALDPSDPTKGITVERKPGEVAAQPFTVDAAPVTLKVPAKKIANWSKDRFDMVGLLHDSPVKSDAPTEMLSLVPMGAARLRISQFPVVDPNGGGTEWPAKPVAMYTASASYCHDGDTLDALFDGILPRRRQGSADLNLPRFTWWDHKGSAEWVQYDFPTAKTVDRVQVYWFDDAKHKGGCRPPASWQVQCKASDGSWKPVDDSSPAGVADDQFNKVTFKPVSTSGLRLAVQLQDGYSGGILEWSVGD